MNGKVAGTTGLEPAASAVTVSGLQVLSTTWKSTDGTASQWKYVVDNVIVIAMCIAPLRRNWSTCAKWPNGVAS
jgi:hypothetical protein